MPVIPPWIKSADPAAHMAQGMHIGIQIGAQQAQERMRQQQMAARAAEQQQEMDAQQAAQRFKEVQAAKQEQLHARDQALAESKYGLMASQAAQKHQAMQEYQSAVTGGMDPNEAMLKWGPAMSANTGAAAAIRANRVPVVPQEVTLPSGMRGVQTGQRFQYEPKASTGAVKIVPEGAVYDPGGNGVPPTWKAKRDTTAQTLVSDRLRANRHVLSEFAKAEANPSFLKALKKNDPKGYEASQNQARAAAESILELQPNDAMALRYAGKSAGTKTASPSYKTAAEVAAQYKAGHISRDEAAKILKEQFGITEAVK